MLQQNSEYKEQWPVNTVHMLSVERILKNPFACNADTPDTKSNGQLGGHHFGSNSSLYGAKLQSNAWGIAQGGMGGFGIDWYVRPSNM